MAYAAHDLSLAPWLCCTPFTRSPPSEHTIPNIQSYTPLWARVSPSHPRSLQHHSATQHQTLTDQAVSPRRPLGPSPMRSESESTSVLPPLLLLLADSDPLLLLSLEEEEDSVLRCSTASDWAAAVRRRLGRSSDSGPGRVPMPRREGVRLGWATAEGAMGSEHRRPGAAAGSWIGRSRDGGKGSGTGGRQTGVDRYFDGPR